MKKIHEGKLTMGRPSRGDGKEIVSIQLWDTASKQHVFDASVSLENFTRIITGQARIDCTFVTGNLSHVGKHRVIEDRSVPEPAGHLSREQLEKWLLDNCQEPGWYVDPYLGSQSSRTRVFDVNMLRYRVFKYVDQVDGEDS